MLIILNLSMKTYRQLPKHVKARIEDIRGAESSVISLIDGLLILRAKEEYSGGTCVVKGSSRHGGLPYFTLLTSREAQAVLGDPEPHVWNRVAGQLLTYPFGEHIFELREVLTHRRQVSNHGNAMDSEGN